MAFTLVTDAVRDTSERSTCQPSARRSTINCAISVDNGVANVLSTSRINLPR